jgi:hypothetical protein
VIRENGSSECRPAVINGRMKDELHDVITITDSLSNGVWLRSELLVPKSRAQKFRLGAFCGSSLRTTFPKKYSNPHSVPLSLHGQKPT